MAALGLARSMFRRREANKEGFSVLKKARQRGPAVAAFGRADVRTDSGSAMGRSAYGLFPAHSYLVQTKFISYVTLIH